MAKSLESFAFLSQIFNLCNASYDGENVTERIKPMFGILKNHGVNAWLVKAHNSSFLKIILEGM